VSTFPAAPIGAKVELGLGSWTDVTTTAFQRNPIGIVRGRPNEQSSVNAAACSMTMNNQDGRFSVNNPLGAYYGTLTLNSPVRVSLPNSLLPSPYNTTYLRMEDDSVSYASCPAASRIELTGSLDVQADIDVSGYGYMPIASIWNASASVNQRSWYFGLNTAGALMFSYTTDGTTATWPQNDATSVLPVPVGRLCVRAVFNATAGTVTFYTAPAASLGANGPWTQLGPVYNTGSTSITLFASTSAPLTVGYSAGMAYDFGLFPLGLVSNVIAPQGAVYDMELYNASSTSVAHPAFNAQSAGATSWTDTPGNTWTVHGTAELSSRAYRFHGEMAELPKASDPTLTDIYTQAVAAGVIRRLSQGNSPLNSPMYRAYARLTGTDTPNAYWPCEDQTLATQLYSPIPGVPPMSVNGPAQMASSSSFVCSDALPVINKSIWTGTVPAMSSSWGANYVRFLLQVPSGGDTDGAVVAQAFTAGTVARMDLVYNTASSGELTLKGYNAAGTNTVSVGPFQYVNNAGAPVPVNGALAEVTMQLTVSGGTVTMTALAILVGQIPYGTGSGTVGSASIGAVQKVVIDPAGNCVGSTVGHISVQASTSVAASNTLVPALNAWNGETAGDRVRRLCTEEGLQVRVYGHSGVSAPMGDQSISTFMSLIQECETTDRGMLYEPRTCVGIGYRTCASLQNQSVRSSASFTGAQLDQAFATTSDDQLTCNDVTVSNLDASSARAVLASGRMSVLAPPNGVGRVDTQVTVNAQADGQLASTAQWILNVSIDYHDRAPTLPFNMARSQTPASIAMLDCGDRLQITSPPGWVQYDWIDQVCAGFSESFGPFGVWQINVNAIPAYPYTVAQEATGSSPARNADTDGSTLSASISTALNSHSQFDAGTTGWAPKNGSLTAIGGSASSQLPAGATTPYGILITPNGAGQAVAWQGDSALTPYRFAVTPATTYYASAVVYSPGGYSSVQVGIDWWTSAGVYISTTFTSVAVSAGVWTALGTSGAAPGTAAFGSVDVGENGSPTSANTLYVTSAMAWTGAFSVATSQAYYPLWTTAAANFPFDVAIGGERVTVMGITGSSSPQAFTVARSVNGVVKPQSSGADVRLFYPPIAAL
jgi:hypothetical protein